MKKNKHRLLTVSALISLTSTSIFFINKAISASAVIKNLLKGKSEKYYDWRFGKIHYKIQGSGSPLLLIHDVSPCCSTDEWKYLCDALAVDHTVYSIDLLGCGCSDRPKITYTNFLYVQLITDFIHNVIKKKTDVITSGLSGSFAVMACRNDETIINRILMINPEDLAVLNQVPTKKSKAAKFILELPLIGTLLYNFIMARGNIDLQFTEHYLHNPFHYDLDLMDAYYESAHLDQGNSKYLLASLKGKYLYCNIAQALQKINNSIYILQGNEENRAKESIALYTSINPSIEYELLPHQKHLPHIEEPDKILETAKIFFI